MTQPTRVRARTSFAVTAALWSFACVPVQAQTALADQPPLSTYTVPGNLALTLSVEFPTAVSVAHTNRTYAAASEYLGYFDPNKCYAYTYNSTDSTSSPNTTAPASYFSPNGTANSHLCTGQWSGNFLNWASMQTIDTFRWVLTGGYRVIDTAQSTVIEKAWASGQGGLSNFPDSSLATADVAGATPFGAAGATGFTTRIFGDGNKLQFSVAQPPVYDVSYFNNLLFLGPPVLQRQESGTSSIPGSGSPGPGVNATNYTARFVTQVTAPASGTYVFRAYGKDTAVVYINGLLVVAATFLTSPATSLIPLTFNAGDTISIQIDYLQSTGPSNLKLQWTTPLNSNFTDIGGGATLGGSAAPYTNAPVLPSSLYEVFVRAKVCDGSTAAGGLEANCTAYGSNAKPEGLLQKYNRQLRYSAFGYLNDPSATRDAGVLRARQKFVGPYQPVYASADVVNSAQEWDASTGVFVRNPDPADATGSGVSDSGVLNYINKFGEITRQGYKSQDPVSELYYASLRYFRNLGNVFKWSDTRTLGTSDRNRLLDGFPAILTWDDPIIFSCQRNFVLGIGDVNTWNDKNVPGNTPTAGEPTKPPEVVADHTTDAVAATLQIGKMEGFTATTVPSLTGLTGAVNPWNPCCSGGNTSALIAGLAYDAHTSDIRPDIQGKSKNMTVDTYWVDVQEFQRYGVNNQYYLATKYGGFTVPPDFQPYSATASLTDASWWNGVAVDPASGQKLPNNYFSGGRPDLMQNGLTTAFAAIASAAGQTYSSSFVTALPQVSSAGTSSFSSSYDASNWSGTLKGSFTTFSSTGTPTVVPGREFGQILTAQGPANRSIATWSVSTSSTIASRGVQFQATTGAGPGATALNTSQLAALDTSYVAGNDAASFLAYLRGDRTKERLATATVADPSRPYRTRVSLLGDIVNSKPTIVGPPSSTFSDSTNPGYNAFKTGSPQATRPTVVYVGANDGMLHAVNGNLATSTATGAGKELFAYVPNALFQGPNGTPNVDGLASLGNPNFVHHYMVDATAQSFDIDFNRTSDGTAAPPTSWSPDWHSVLIGGLGKGGRAFFALDITDPASMTNELTLASKVLWEFTQAQYLGYSFGEAAVVKTKKYGWVVVLPSGYNNADGVGHLMFLNPKTGKLLETVTMPSGSAGLAHVNAWSVDGTDGTADALYAGDLQGNLWRVDVTGAFGTAYPAPLRLAQFTDGSSSHAAQPVTTRPRIAIDPSTGNRFVLVGTGRLLDSSDIGQALPAGQVPPGPFQSFYAIIDGTNAAFNATAPSGVTFPISRSQLHDNTSSLTSGASTAAVTAAGWYIDLVNPSPGPASRVLIDPSTSNGAVAFSTVEPNGNACSPGGSGAYYVINFGSARSIVLDTTSAIVSYLPTTDVVTDNSLISYNGTLTGLLGSGGTVKSPGLSPNGGNSTRRLNWREVPLAD